MERPIDWLVTQLLWLFFGNVSGSTSITSAIDVHDGRGSMNIQQSITPSVNTPSRLMSRSPPNESAHRSIWMISVAQLLISIRLRSNKNPPFESIIANIDRKEGRSWNWMRWNSFRCVHWKAARFLFSFSLFQIIVVVFFCFFCFLINLSNWRTPFSRLTLIYGACLFAFYSSVLFIYLFIYFSPRSKKRSSAKRKVGALENQSFSLFDLKKKKR